MQGLKVLSIQSFTVLGTASLKSFISILGSRVLPVNTIQLTALGNVSNHIKFEIDLEKLLQGTFQHIHEQNLKIILHVGYVANARQIDLITTFIKKNNLFIESIVIDPICGDNGQAYVSEDIIQKWSLLLQLADIALPNATEVQLLTNSIRDPLHESIQLFQNKFPDLDFIVTSFPEEESVGYLLVQKENTYTVQFENYAQKLSGTGDTFAALLILYHFYKQLPLPKALEKAGTKMHELIENSIKKDSSELIIELL